MLLLAPLLLGAACALAAPAAHARSWVMTPDPVVLELPSPGIEWSAIDTPPEVIGLVNDEESLSLDFVTNCGCAEDCLYYAHFDQQPIAVWWQPHSVGCFAIGEGPFSVPPFNLEVAPGEVVRMDFMTLADTAPCSATLTFEFSQFPAQVDFWGGCQFEPLSGPFSATVDVAALAPTLGSLGMALLAAGFVLATLVAARPIYR